MDDVIVYSKTIDIHIQHLNEVFQVIKLHNLKLKPKKCFFGMNKVAYLGHIINSEGVHVDNNKTNIMNKFPIPTKKKDILSFLGLTGYYRRFVPNYSEISRPLVNLTKKNVAFQFEQEEKEAFETLKEYLTNAPVLSFPRFDLPFILQTDASNHGIGSVLAQRLDDGEHPIAYASRQLKKAELNYTTTEKECLAVVWLIHHFRQYLEHDSFIIQTDHAALKWLLMQKEPVGRIARWITSIMQYKFTVSTRSGKYHLNADAFSRQMCKDTYVVFQIKGGMLDEHHKLLTKYIKGERVDSVDKKLKQKLRRWKKKVILDKNENLWWKDKNKNEVLKLLSAKDFK